MYFCSLEKKEKSMDFDYGYWEISVEKSGRVKLPAALLRALPEEDRKVFQLTRGFGDHVMLWTNSAYQQQLAYLNSLNRDRIIIKKYRNAFLSSTVRVECDAHDRFVIPRSLSERYNLENQIVLLLDNGKIEIWNSDLYHAEFDMSSEEFNLLNEAIHLGKFDSQEEGGDVS